MEKRPNFPETKGRRDGGRRDLPDHPWKEGWWQIDHRISRPRKCRRSTGTEKEVLVEKLAEKRAEANARRDEHLERTINNAPEDKKSRLREPKTRRTTGVTVLAVHPVEEAARSNPLHFLGTNRTPVVLTPWVRCLTDNATNPLPDHCGGITNHLEMAYRISISRSWRHHKPYRLEPIPAQ